MFHGYGILCIQVHTHTYTISIRVPIYIRTYMCALSWEYIQFQSHPKVLSNLLTVQCYAVALPVLIQGMCAWMRNPFPTMKIEKHHMFLHACVPSHSDHLPTAPSQNCAISQPRHLPVCTLFSWLPNVPEILSGPSLAFTHRVWDYTHVSLCPIFSLKLK